MGHNMSKQSLMMNIDKDKEISAPLIDPTMTPEKKKTNEPTTRSVDDMRKTGCIPKTRPTQSNKARKLKVRNKLPKAPPSSPSAEQQVTDLLESHDDRNLSFLSTTLTVPRQLIEKDSNGVRRFIIKIQLTKMEEPPIMEKVIHVDASEGSVNEIDENNANGTTNNAANNNLNAERSYLNLTFTKNIPCDLGTEIDPQITFETGNGTEIKLNNLSQRTPGSQDIVTDEFLENFSLESLDNGEGNFMQKFNEPQPSTSRGISSSTTSTMSTPATSVINNINITLQQMNTFRVLGTEVTVCTKAGQSQSVNLQNKNAIGGIKNSNSDIKVGDGKTPLSCGKKSGACASKWVCCKCACRDIIKKFLETTRYTTGPNAKNIWSSKFNCAKRNIADNKERKGPKEPENASGGEGPKGGAGKEKDDLKGRDESRMRTQRRGEAEAPKTAGSSNSAQSSRNRNLNRRRELTFWSPRDVLYPIASKYPPANREPQPQIVVVQCPPSQIITVNQIVDLEDRVRQLRNTERSLPGPLSSDPRQRHAAMHVPNLHNTNSCGIVNGASSGVRAHSQVDYIHCLVPDLEQITSSSFYWGKMDRYEAERLLEGKAEGTFLLRDSAQEEYLFSVTFRKYGRSLHARIEQFNHKFSFDCHDPGVFTASTVTALLEHYKDPSCVMFFEPMLTIPLNRNFSFSLQQLARAAMVSNISYDGIKGLELPKSLKSYLKDYHYKLRVRVKPFDEPMYTCS